MLSQSNGQTVPQFGCSIGKCSDSKVFFVSLIDTGDAKTRVDGAPEGSGVIVPEGTEGCLIPVKQTNVKFKTTESGPRPAYHIARIQRHLELSALRRTNISLGVACLRVSVILSILLILIYPVSV